MLIHSARETAMRADTEAEGMAAIIEGSYDLLEVP